MSYPEPRYLGEKGQVSAVFLPASPQPDAGSSDNQISYVAKQENTNGEFGLYKINMGPKAMGATEHFHRTISESSSRPSLTRPWTGWPSGRTGRWTRSVR
ncbi:hypothetical protein [Streptomyces arenae]|uniref:hypothetical protein n=1 Tax=Streptomyces arenae TaxID=29301 RepID=UPI00265A0320|nr:hypothetical protein [Streptomyces arenae]MCG7205190.1 hypothetical protein [Streptomyces arenae]